MPTVDPVELRFKAGLTPAPLAERVRELAVNLLKFADGIDPFVELASEPSAAEADCAGSGPRAVVTEWQVHGGNATDSFTDLVTADEYVDLAGWVHFYRDGAKVASYRVDVVASIRAGTASDD